LDSASRLASSSTPGSPDVGTVLTQDERGRDVMPLLKVVRSLADLPPVLTDKHKTLMTLINLVSNARYALDGVPPAGTTTPSASAWNSPMSRPRRPHEPEREQEADSRH
jgi:hypothetical protein